MNNFERKKVFAGNWKMNHGPKEALEYFSQFNKVASAKKQNSEQVLFVPAYCLNESLQEAAKKAALDLGAQNIHWEEKGAFTGELSATTLYSLGIRWALVGHSERRQFFGDTDASCVKRFERAVKSKLNVVYCIGESLAERESNQTEEVLKKQTLALLPALASALESAPDACFAIAYEPIWAIGTGKTATTEQAEHAHRHIRKIIWDHLNFTAAQKTPILYGGSVTAQNSEQLLSQPNIDGVLVGGASLQAESFAKILVQVS